MKTATGTVLLTIVVFLLNSDGADGSGAGSSSLRPKLDADEAGASSSSSYYSCEDGFEASTISSYKTCEEDSDEESPPRNREIRHLEPNVEIPTGRRVIVQLSNGDELFGYLDPTSGGLCSILLNGIRYSEAGVFIHQTRNVFTEVNERAGITNPSYNVSPFDKGDRGAYPISIVTELGNGSRVIAGLALMTVGMDYYDYRAFLKMPDSVIYCGNFRYV